MPNSEYIAVVLNYKRPKDSIECLVSLQQSTKPPVKTIVVDNNSADGSSEMIVDAFPDVLIVRTEKNLGYAGGMNAGIREALKYSPVFISLLNSDTLVAKEYMELLITTLEANPQAGVASGTIYYYPETEQVWYGGGKIIQWRGSGFSRHGKRIRSNITNSRPSSVSFVSGCGFVIRSSVIPEVGGFDERFFMYLEDTELCHRILNYGYSLLYVPNAKLYHKVVHHGLEPFPLYFSARNRFLFLKLCTKGLRRTIGYLYLIATLTVKSFIWLFNRRNLIRASYFGIYDFYVGRYYEGRGFQLNQ